MRNIVILSFIFTIFVLSGCVGKMPQNADEFRQALPGAFMGKVETFDVNRPFHEVAATFQEMAPKCLDITIKTVSQTYMSYQVIVAKYTPTVVVTDERAELHLQELHESGVLNVYKEPENGHYLLVTDAIPIDANTTKITMYRPAMGQDVLIRAIKGWATGDNVGCPDLTK